MNLAKSAAVLLVVAGVFVYAGCGAAETTVQKDAKGPFADAVQLYQQACVNCHGSNLSGRVGPSLQHVGSTLTRQQITDRIEEGGGPMPGYGPTHLGILSQKQIDALAAWLSSKH